MAILSARRTPEECATSLDEELDSFLHFDGSRHKPKVCFCCDRLLQKSTESKKVFTLKQLAKLDHLFVHDQEIRPDLTIHDDIIKYYKYKGPMAESLTKCVLSPNSNYCPQRRGFLVCNSCFSSLRKRKYPFYGIRNGFMIGTAPDVVEALSDVELSCISLVRNTGHIISYMGGEDKMLRGWHSMVEVEIRDVHRTLQGLNHKDLNFPDIIAIVLTGPMTAAQLQRAKNKATASKNKMLAALHWFIANNIHYRKKFGDGFDPNLIPEPVIVNRTTPVDSVNTNIELTEEMNVVFPDATLDETTGGFHNADDFKEVISEINKGNTSVTVTSKASRYVYSDQEDNFVRAFPKQFPYGTGGRKDLRLNAKGKKEMLSFRDFLRHINNLSNRNFHTADFSVISWNVLEKARMLYRSALKVKGNPSLQAKIANAQAPDVADFIRNIQEGKINKHRGGNGGTGNGAERLLLQTVDSVTNPLPHTNEAAKEARKKAFSLQLAFGFPTIFFTVTPDDGTSYTVSIYSGMKFHPTERVDTFDENDLIRRARERHKFRIKYPGVGAIWYKQVMDAVWRNIIGWDFDTNCPTEKPGVYGKPVACFESTEEQVRKRLHGHGVVWIEGADLLFQHLQSNDRRQVSKAKQELAQLHDDTTSTSLVNESELPHSLFPHQSPCKETVGRAPKPVAMDAQHLRDMRHRTGKTERKGVVAHCQACRQEYTVDQLVTLCLKHVGKKENLDCLIAGDNWKDSKSTLEELLFMMTSPHNQSDPESIALVTNVLRNLHSWKHAPQCFKYDHECRYSFPKSPSLKTTVELAESFDSWFDWLGNKGEYNKYEIVEKRNQCDVFMNQYNKAISMSRLGSNSNSQCSPNGQKAMYCTKYPTKSTQEEEESEYGNVLLWAEKRLMDQRFDLDYSEALSRLIGASLAHSANNVISPWLAKHLINEGSRFRFSHEFRNIPHASVQAELFDEPLKYRRVKSFKTQSYIDSGPLQYLNRPKQLSDLSLTEFTCNYHVKARCEIKKNDEMYDFDYANESDYQAGQYQGVLKSASKYLPVLNVWAFPDTCQFDGSLLDPLAPINEHMEDYALEVLVCFCPFRLVDDLHINGSHVLKFRQWYNSVHCSDEVKKMLINLQNFKNSCRMKRTCDTLARHTQKYHDPNLEHDKATPTMQQKERYDETTKHFIDQILASTSNQQQQSATTDDDDKGDFDLAALREKGTWNCGFKNIARHEKLLDEFPVETVDDDDEGDGNNATQQAAGPIHPPITKQRLVEVFLQRTERKVKDRRPCDADENDSTTLPNPKRPQHEVQLEATGTPESIYLWGKQSFGDDAEQNRAFQILAAKFVLSYVEEAEEGDDEDNQFSAARPFSRISATERKEYIRCRRVLTDMIGKPAKDGQLIMFLTGPGGSGKSEVINQLLVYCRDFCGHIDRPFTSRTILVTACSGVAATLIGGQTLHSATFLNSKRKNIDLDDKLNFQNSVRLLIVDEISMLKPSELKTLNQNLNWLMDKPGFKYGGIDVAFMGDFRQLPPVGFKPIYDAKSTEFVTYVNCYIELDGMYRFRHDMEWGYSCLRFRDGCPLPKDFNKINGRIVTDDKCLPADVRAACKKNDEREAINVANFLKHLEEHGENQGLIVLADEVQVRQVGLPDKPLANLKRFWTQVGEDDCETHMEGRFTPMLRCYPGAPLMMTRNRDVAKCLANGTQGQCMGIKLKRGKQVHQRRINGFNIKCVYASEVDHLKWQTEHDGRTKIMKIEPVQYQTLRADFPLPDALRVDTYHKAKVFLKATQLPLISNNATTGHKLQGSTLNDIYVPSWSYGVNWPYVVMSRVRTLGGLFTGQQLDPSKDYSVPANLIKMIRKIKWRARRTDFNYTLSAKHGRLELDGH